MMKLLLTALLASTALPDPDGLHRRVMCTVEDAAGWHMHLRLDRDALLLGLERRLLAETRLRRPQAGAETALVKVEILNEAGERLWRQPQSLPCDREGAYCQLRWEVEASSLMLPGLYRLRTSWPEAGLELTLDFRLRPIKKGRPHTAAAPGHANGGCPIKFSCRTSLAPWRLSRPRGPVQEQRAPDTLQPRWCGSRRGCAIGPVATGVR